MIQLESPLDSDFDFYCFMKLNLPTGYRIAAEPSTAYYSEWLFDYRVFRGEELVRTFSGDFRQLASGSLVRAAGDFLASLGIKNAHW